MRQLHSDFYCFFKFLDWIFFLGVFPIHWKFILGLVFCLNQISISRKWLFVPLRHFDFGFLFFKFFWFNFLKILFPILSKSVIGLVFVYSIKFLWIVGQDLSSFVFLLRLTDCRFNFPDFLELTFSLTSVTATALQLKFVSVTSFLLLGQLRDLPHQKNDFWSLLWNFKFYEHLLLKGSSVHLSSAKLICPNSWVIESWV